MNWSKNILNMLVLITLVLVCLPSKLENLLITAWIMIFITEINRAVATINQVETSQEFSQSLQGYSVMIVEPVFFVYLSELT